MTRILFVGGGSIGHIAPSVAIWNAYKNIQEGATAHFVCSPKPEDITFLKENQLEYTALHAPRLSLGFPLVFVKAVQKAHVILRAVKPDVVFSKGGYVSVPLCFAAHRQKIPIVLHESDAVSGYANRLVSLWAHNVCKGFPTVLRSPVSSYHFTGNPVRSDIAKGSKKEGLAFTGLKGDRPILLVIGGSQGAKGINNTIVELLPDILLRCDVIHITGVGKQTNISKEGYFQTEFAHDELKDIYACATVAVSRAGAGSLSELSVCRIPTIVIPLRDVGHDHQYKNAQVAAKSGGCMHIEQSEMMQKLLPAVHTIVTDKKIHAEMAHKITTLSNPDAALQIAKIVVSTLDSMPRGK